MAWNDHQGRLTGQLILGNQLLKTSQVLLPPRDNPLALFSHLSLEELGSGSLLDRKETKYIFSKDRMISLLHGLETDYRVLEVNRRRSFDYHSVYFDTPERTFYRQHHAGALPRWKIRQRTYLNSGLSFLEVKYKDNRGVTHKTRQQISSSTGALFEGAGLLQDSNFPARIGSLKSVLETRYSRITLVFKDKKERITIDRQLGFSHDGHSRSLSGLVIAEIKQAQLNPGSPFIKQMKEIGIRPGPFSKYCIGSTLLDPSLKHNRFKPILHQIASLGEGEISHE